MRYTVYIIITLYVTVVCSDSRILSSGSYDPRTIVDKIFKFTNIEPRRGYGLIKFEDEDQVEAQNENKIKFQDDLDDFDQIKQGELGIPNYNVNEGSQTNQNRVKFQDVEDQKVKKKRRRKPKQYGLQRYPGYGAQYGQGYQGNFNGQATGGFYRPPQSTPSDAVSTVTQALTSIALNDDLQCVPRLLCESTGSAGGSSSSGILQSIAGLTPLLTLLSTSSGATSSPLFVFGRAVLLGVTSKASDTCQLAYPQCPTDPEKLIFYLNNHNGGFFRFFNNPQLNHQNFEQFYNKEHQNQGYGLYQPNYSTYGNDYSYSNYGYKKKIQRRILNKPNQEGDKKFSISSLNNRNENIFTFPEQNQNVDENNRDFIRKARGFVFPDNQVDAYNTRYLGYTGSNSYTNGYIKHKDINKETDENVQILYVVRGNGDPNHPEVIRLKPGEKINI